MDAVNMGSVRDRRINVLEVIGNAGIGGMENYIKNLISHLPKDKFRITCICPYESSFTDTLRQLGVEGVFVTAIEDDPNWRSIQLVTEVARLNQIDVLHAHMPKAHVLAGLVGCLIHKPVVATVHGMHLTSHELGITRIVESHLITNCQEAYTQALAMGVPHTRVELIRNGVDISLFTPDRTNESLRDALNLLRSFPIVGFVGRLDYEKGPDLFLRVAEYVHRILPHVHFVMVGEGAMQRKLVSICAQMRLSKCMHILGWNTNTADIYRSLDILAHTSRSDGTSLVLLEAMACACPTVGLAVGGVREIIENENTGFTNAPGDWEGLGMRVVTLLKQPERLKIMGKAARARIEQHFNLACNIRRTSEVLTRTVFGFNPSKHRDNSLSRDISYKPSLDSTNGLNENKFQIEKD
jgi:glycosyltransferase involved in cell wall biosynthesis